MEEVESGVIPGGSEMTAEDAALCSAQREYMVAKDKVIKVLQPWVVTINGVSLAEEVATLTLAALGMAYPTHPTRESETK